MRGQGSFARDGSFKQFLSKTIWRPYEIRIAISLVVYRLVHAPVIIKRTNCCARKLGSTPSQRVGRPPGTNFHTSIFSCFGSSSVCTTHDCLRPPGLRVRSTLRTVHYPGRRTNLSMPIQYYSLSTGGVSTTRSQSLLTEIMKAAS